MRENGGDESGVLAEGGVQWLTNTCHLWAEGGIGQQKVAAGWRPAKDDLPGPVAGRDPVAASASEWRA